MTFKSIFYIIPIPIFYHNSKFGSDAKSYGIIIFINNRAKNDIGLLKHELTHCKQFFRTIGLHPILYRYSKSYRYDSEIEAYAVQLIENNKDINQRNRILDFIENNYGLNVSRVNIARDLAVKIKEIEDGS